MGRIATFYSISSNRFIDNVREIRSSEIPENKDDPERILSRRPTDGDLSTRQTQKRSSRGHIVVQVILLGIIVIGGIAAILGLRELGADFGVVWFGDQ